MAAMTRGELARLSGCNAETIRYYEKTGLIPAPLRSANGYRQYDATHVSRLRFILRGRELGFAIEDLKSLLELVDKNAISCREVEKRASEHLCSVRNRIEDLRRIEKVLADTVQTCSGEDVPDCPLIESLFRG
ncbi:MAG: helix-turn-helix domain-containing protein [Pseudohongiellaceae bacterium]